jgi:hypothetical protein
MGPWIIKGFGKHLIEQTVLPQPLPLHFADVKTNVQRQETLCLFSSQSDSNVHLVLKIRAKAEMHEIT